MLFYGSKRSKRAHSGEEAEGNNGNRGLQVLDPDVVTPLQRKATQYKGYLVEQNGGGACKSTIQKTNQRLTAEKSIRAVVALACVVGSSHCMPGRGPNMLTANASP